MVQAQKVYICGTKVIQTGVYIWVNLGLANLWAMVLQQQELNLAHTQSGLELTTHQLKALFGKIVLKVC
ncbi:hypothetical protein A2459_04620 [Candidatus Roizmanbacteria bacterium RIFOXYC2_FULL_41_10]|nr:MAG: hypothetical protein A2459_04620 [Candidatus Roizmanbacteria bacterium RIFOXYC2_FULL_41_10]